MNKKLKNRKIKTHNINGSFRKQNFGKSFNKFPKKSLFHFHLYSSSRGGNNCWDYGTIDFGIIWNYFWNSLKICIKFHWNSWNYFGIPGIPMELLEFLWDYCTMRNFNYFPLASSLSTFLFIQDNFFFAYFKDKWLFKL